MHDTIATKPDHAELFEIASGQRGYFTADQARRVGVGSDLLTYHTNTGDFDVFSAGCTAFATFHLP